MNKRRALLVAIALNKKSHTAALALSLRIIARRSFGKVHYRTGLLGALLLPGGMLHAAVWHVAPERLPEIPPARQFRTISEAARVAQAGDTVRIHSGVYRETVVVESSGTRARPISFEAAIAANVIITGLDRLRGWQKETETENTYSVEWPHRFTVRENEDAYPADDYHRMIGRSEVVLVNGYLLPQSFEHRALGRGSFSVDTELRRLYVSPPTGEKLTDDRLFAEAATRSLLWHSKGDYITVRGVRFRYAANHAQGGAVIFDGRGDVAEDCVFERMNSVGATFSGLAQTVRRCLFRENGQIGFLAYRAHRLLVTGCVVRNNNTKGFKRDWEAGGAKLVLSRGVTVEKTQFLENRGIGLWFDLGNENCTVRNCLLADNEAAGLFYEISYGLRAHDNVMTGNGLVPDGALWGAQAGIVISSSPHCEITRNILVGNREGFAFRELLRTTPKIDAPAKGGEVLIWTQGVSFTHNIIAYNTEAQTRGWFAMEDERHWPRRLQQEPCPGSADPLGRDRHDERPSELSQLQFRLARNVYATSENQPLLIWGASWLRYTTFDSLGAVRETLGLEQGSRIRLIRFRQYIARDLRVGPHDPSVTMRCYPVGEVPGVRLGVRSVGH